MKQFMWRRACAEASWPSAVGSSGTSGTSGQPTGPCDRHVWHKFTNVQKRAHLVRQLDVAKRVLRDHPAATSVVAVDTVSDLENALKRYDDLVHCSQHGIICASSNELEE